MRGVGHDPEVAGERDLERAGGADAVDDSDRRYERVVDQVGEREPGVPGRVTAGRGLLQVVAGAEARPPVGTRCAGDHEAANGARPVDRLDRIDHLEQHPTVDRVHRVGPVDPHDPDILDVLDLEHVLAHALVELVVVVFT